MDPFLVTLNPNTQGPTRGDCRGDNSSGQAWFSVWSNNACYNTYDDFIYNSKENAGEWSKENWEESQKDFVQILNKYLGEGNKITEPGFPGYDPFQEQLGGNFGAFCNSLAGVCDIALSSFCQGKTTIPPCPNCQGQNGCGSECATREGIASNKGILGFCGCYAPLPNVEQARRVISKDPQCDPLCTRQRTISLDDGKGNFLQCNNDTCVIDDVTIEASRSTIGGTVNFNQMCSNCDPCTCIISGIDITTTAEQIDQFKVEFNQFCGKNSLCLKIEPDGVDKTIDCQKAITAQTSPTDSTIPWWIIVGGVIFIVIVALILVFVYKDK
uniref:Transmembrane protein n=1 Tax=Pithovirus LCPAC202 TaxID=2506592 RepID=A0A481Z6R3_9VIRU|nr:MAG: transmembrane protein [Pithovirus LCPAC202]